MKMVKRAIQGLALGACALAAVPAAHAKAQPGFYMGLSAVKSTFDLDKEEFDDVIEDAFFSAGSPVINGSSTFEDSDTSTAFFLGYRFLPYVSIELGYLNLGTAEYRSTGTINPIGPTASAPAIANIDLTTKGVTLAGIGSIPIGEVFDLHGRLGVFIANTELEVTATRNTGVGTGTASESIDSVSAYFGIGAAFHLGDHWSLSLDWTKYANVGDEDEDEDFTTTEGFDVDTLSFSAMFKF